MGFTAINAPKPVQSAVGSTLPAASAAEMSGFTINEASVTGRQAKSVASEYLGRSDPTPELSLSDQTERYRTEPNGMNTCETCYLAFPNNDKLLKHRQLAHFEDFEGRTTRLRYTSQDDDLRAGKAIGPSSINEDSTSVVSHSDKQLANKGRKRTITTDAPASSKRRKPSNMLEGMQVTKPNTHSKPPYMSKSKIPNSPDKDAGATRPQTTNAKTRSMDRNLDDTFDDEIANVSTHSICVVAPTTSMDNLNSSSQLTSVDALRDSTGHGATLYGSNHTVDKIRDHLNVNGQKVVQQSSNDERAAHASSARVLRPRKAASGASIGFVATTDEHEIDVSEIVTTKKASYHTGTSIWLRKQNFRPAVGKSRETQHVQTVSELPTTSNDEDFIGDDDDIADALELPNTPKASTRSINRSDDNLEPRKRSTSDEEDFLADDDDTAESLAVANIVEAFMKSPNEIDPNFSPGVPIPTSANPRKPIHCQGGKKLKKNRKPTPMLTPDEEFIDLDHVEEEAELVDLTNEMKVRAVQKPLTPPTREWKLNMRKVDRNEDYGGGLFSEAEVQLLDKVKFASQHTTKPTVRMPFPTPILDRSPLFGASNSTTLRTCFRIGEALKEGSQAARANKAVILELYARVTSSWREPKPGRKQHFVFKDLYHDNPPHLEGEFTLWDQNRLWELDSRAFLGKRDGGVMCRAIAKMKREGMRWKLEVLSIWEASWEDVDYVAGIYAKEPEFGDG